MFNLKITTMKKQIIIVKKKLEVLSSKQLTKIKGGTYPEQPDPPEIPL